MANELHRHRTWHAGAGLLCACCLGAFGTSIQAEEAADWQRRVLNSPTGEDLLAEARGRVFIYDGLHEREVEQALDRQFHRVQSMMFIRTRVPQPDGSEEVEDDCD